MLVALCPSCPENKTSILWGSKTLEVGVGTRLGKNETFRNILKNEVANWTIIHLSSVHCLVYSPTWSGLHDLTLPSAAPPKHESLLFTLRTVDGFLPSRASEILQRFLKCLSKYPSQLNIIFSMLIAPIFQESSRDFLTKVFHMCMFSEGVLHGTSDESFIELLKIWFLFNTI